jgi:bacillithiol biosynthesis cysteine-adding enzyme BshC
VARSFSTSYLAGEWPARALFPRDFRDRAARVARTREAASRTIDPALAALLREQQARLPPSAARQANLEALCAGGAAVVVTGQQVGLFLGPLYTLYKAASAVALAQALEVESGVRCVPIFWLQTEDHDFAEIATCIVAGRDGAPICLSLIAAELSRDSDAAVGRVSIAHRALGEELPGLHDALAEALPAGPAADELLALLRLHYAPGRSLASAFAGVLGTLFADHGLLVIDPRDARLAALAAPIYRTAIDSSAAIDGLLQERGGWLASVGFEQQVTVRAGCPLVFFHPDGPTGQRFRLVRPERAGAAGWALAGSPQLIDAGELRRALDHEPLRFSTSALLRPIVQDALLPAAAYVAGPGEINYFAQLGAIYPLFGVSPALLVPRARFRFIDARCRRLLSALALDAGDLARPRAELLARLGSAGAPDGGAAAGPGGDGADPVALRRRLDDEIAPVVEQIARQVAALDPHLARPAQRTRDTVARAVGRLIDRAARTLAARDQTQLGRLDRLRRALYPDGVPQERFYGWPSLAGRHGPRALTQMVMERLRQSGPFLVGEQDLRP